ncbi:ATP-grasp domain-containing protein [Kaistella carnis]|uniref:ATP-grasp domain-containing protein n=1 Tax=Kaistella carnis TaxID=1241979 RepID=UPI0028A6ADCF|nr:ATP-grasp domain-containing protein [Kaistella carnis]
MNILLTSAGRRSYLVKYFKEAMQGLGKVYASNSEFTIALQEADSFFISPLIYESNYIASLIKFCKENNITAILSLFDIDLLVLSKAKDEIESHGIKLLLSGEEVVGMCNDKWKTYLFLKKHHIATPITYKSMSDTVKALENKELHFPIVIKPRWGMASMGIYMVDNFDELNFYYKKAVKDVQNSYLKYESNLTPDEMILFQEKLVGQEYGLDVMNDLEGNFICVLPKSKILMRAGETDLGQTVSPLKFENVAKLLSENIKHETILSVDCFDVNGEIYIIEMNCRISGHYPLSHLAGTNLPKQIIEWLYGKPTDLNNFKFTENLFITKDLLPVILNR